MSMNKDDVMSQVELARTIATVAHLGQVDKAGVAYIEHPRRVAEHCAGKSELVVASAWLHDVIEDTQVTAETLMQLGVHQQVANAVQLLTRRRGNQDSYYSDIVNDESGIALAVKLADIKDNTDPSRLAKLDDETQARLLKKYAKAYRSLGFPELADGLGQRIELAQPSVYDRIHAWVDEMHDSSQVHHLEIGAVMHGMADHTHLLRIIRMLEPHGQPAGYLFSYFQGVASVLNGNAAGNDEAWGAERIMASQSVSMGTPSQYSVRGHQSPVPAQDVAHVLSAITIAHAESMCQDIIADLRMLDGRGDREKFWPQELSLGRYFHALGDNAESAAWESQ